MPCVSVIVPVYNAYNTLPRCVNSVLNQTMRDLELLLVNDGSADASGALCDAMALADSRIRVLHKKNGGPSSARNLGLEKATGSWIVFLDADDMMSPVLLETALQASRLQPGRLVLWPSASTPEETACTVNCEGRSFGFDGMARLQLETLLPMPWNKLFSRSLIQSQGLCFDKNYTLGEDLLFCLDYARALKAQGGEGLFALNAPLTYYEQDVPNSLTHRLRPDYFELWQTLYDRLFADCTEVFHCPEQDLAQLHRAVLQTIAAGARDLVLRGDGSAGERRRQVKSVLKDPWLLAHADAMRRFGLYSPYEPALFLHSPRLIKHTFEQRQTNPSRFYYLQSLGEALRHRNPFRRRSA